MRDVSRRFSTARSIPLRRASHMKDFLLERIKAGIGAVRLGALVAHLGIDEKWSELAMTIGFFVVLIVGGWAYEHFINSV